MKDWDALSGGGADGPKAMRRGAQEEAGAFASELGGAGRDIATELGTWLTQTPEGHRFLIEEGMTTAGAALAGPAGLGAKVLSWGNRGRKALQAAGLLGGAGLGGGVGSLLAETVDPSADPLGRAAETAAWAAGGEVLPLAGSAAKGALRRSAARSFDEASSEARMLDEFAQEEGLPVPVQDVTEGGSLQNTYNLAEWAPGGGVYDTQRSRLANRAQERLVEANAAVGATQQTTPDVGQLVIDTLERQDTAFRKRGGAMFDEVRDQIGNPQMDLAFLYETTEDGTRALDPEALGVLAQYGDRRIVGKLRRGEALTWDDAKELRTALQGALNEPGSSQNIPFGTRREMRSAVESLTDEMGAAAETSSPGAAAAWQRARDFWSAGSDVYNADAVVTAIKQDPEQVYDALMAGGGKRTRLRALKRALYAPEFTGDNPAAKQAADQAVDELRGQYIRDVLDLRPGEELGGATAAAKRNKMKRPTRSGFEEELFQGAGPELANVRRTLGALQQIQRSRRTGMVANLRQGGRALGGAGAAAGGAFNPAVAMGALSTVALNRLVASRPFGKALRGFAEAKTPGAAARWANRISEMIARAPRLGRQGREFEGAAVEEPYQEPPKPDRNGEYLYPETLAERGR